LPEEDSEKGVRGIVSRRVDQSTGGLKKRLAFDEDLAVVDPEYVASMFDKREKRKGPAAARRS